MPKNNGKSLPVLYKEGNNSENDFTEREILYKVLFEMKKDVSDLKKLTQKIMNGEVNYNQVNSEMINKVYEYDDMLQSQTVLIPSQPDSISETKPIQAQEIEAQESLSLQDKEIEMIKSALEKYKALPSLLNTTLTLLGSITSFSFSMIS